MHDHIQYRYSIRKRRPAAGAGARAAARRARMIAPRRLGACDAMRPGRALAAAAGALRDERHGHRKQWLDGGAGGGPSCL
jgi:hypothetical protein